MVGRQDSDLRRLIRVIVKIPIEVICEVFFTSDGIICLVVFDTLTSSTVTTCVRSFNHFFTFLAGRWWYGDTLVRLHFWALFWLIRGLTRTIRTKWRPSSAGKAAGQPLRDFVSRSTSFFNVFCEVTNSAWANSGWTSPHNNSSLIRSQFSLANMITQNWGQRYA